MISSILERAIQVGGEAAILLLFKTVTMSESICVEDRIPLKPGLDTIVYEMAFKYGRADIVIFHIDGTASVIEVKDGSRGYGHVVAGIGQASLYAAQLGMNKATLASVRKCLLWTSTGDITADAAIEEACEMAKTIPLPWGSIKVHLEGAKELLKKFGLFGEEDGPQEAK